MRNTHLAALAAGLTLAAISSPAFAQNTTFDEQVNFNTSGDPAFFVVSTSDPAIAPTGSGNLNPALSLEIGKRYKFVLNQVGLHPLALIARDLTDDPGSDSVLTVQGASSGSFEGNPGVDYHENNGTGEFYFNLTPAFADALNGSSTQGPGYRCNVHTFDMRGPISYRTLPTAIEWNSGTDDFENAALGANVQGTFGGWVIVTDAPSDYHARISDVPAAAAGQAPGSTRWLTITDNHDAASVQDRVYAATLSPDVSETVGSYTFTAYVNIQSLGTADVLFIAQHDDAGTMRNVGGLRINSTGVSTTIIGTDDGGIGKAGATTNDPLYTYADAGGFAMGEWVRLSFTMDYQTNEVLTSAIGSSGSTTINGGLAGLNLQGAGTTDVFRLCIRNTGAGNTSVISYDNVQFFGIGLPSGVDGWNVY